MSRSSQPEKLGDILRDFLHSSGLASRLKYLEIYTAWEEVLGPDLAPHTRIAGFTRQKLYVDVDSSAHLQELATFFKGGLLKDLHERLPTIRIQDIVFRPAPLNRTQHA